VLIKKCIASGTQKYKEELKKHYELHKEIKKMKLWSITETIQQKETKN